MAQIDVRKANTAASATGPSPASGGDSNKGRGPAPLRTLVVVLAVVAIAFCAWSAGEYARGNDPLAVFSGPTTVQQSDASGDGNGSSPDSAPSQAEITSEDVRSYIANNLEFSGVSATVPTDDFQVYLAGSGVWVEQKSDANADDLVTLTAERAAALAAWLNDQQADTQGVTWITEDVHGVIRMVVRDALTIDPTGDAATLLGSAQGYLISPETYVALGDVSFAASAGSTPTLPDGTELKVDAIVSTDAEGNAAGTTLVSQDQTQAGSTGTEQSGATGGTASDESGQSEGSSSSGSISTSPSSGASRGQSGGSLQSSSERISVTVSINGSSSRVSVPAGSTAYDALLATGASVNAGPNPYGAGTWVYGINGQDQGTSSSHGWTYAVDGTLPDVMSDLYVLSDGASVSWNFV